MPDRPPARHEVPEIDAAALTAARAVDALIASARRIIADRASTDDGVYSLDASRHAAAATRWATYFERLPDELRDAPVPQLRGVARRARAGFGPKDSVRDVFGPEVTEPLLDAIDRLVKTIARFEAHDQ